MQTNPLVGKLAMTPVRSEIGKLPDQDAYRHILGEDGRESLAHMLILPKHAIAGYFYPSVKADGIAKGRICLFGPGLPEPFDEEVEARVASEMNFGDWRTPNLSMAIRQPHRVVDFSWESERLQLHGRFEGYHPPYAFSSHPLGNPPYYGDDRTEQHGRLTGELVVDGKLYELNDHMVRDHSWGPRVWGLNQHYKWFHAITGSCSAHFFEMMSFGKRQLRGFLFKDGVMCHVVSADYDMTYDKDMMQTTFQTTVTDTAGRSVFIACEAFANFQVNLDPVIMLNEAPVTLTIDGEPGSGWCEFCWNRDYLAFAKRYVERFYK